ncbi:hypothetical protein IQ07DRAFT_427468 [Pyrenochaeta sp. DS3sAY3a]|nr:hypothetical protein IQ07DRAFT_427468 [Pyrenochaeta sp. DS3sAY3a]
MQVGSERSNGLAGFTTLSSPQQRTTTARLEIWRMCILVECHSSWRLSIPPTVERREERAIACGDRFGGDAICGADWRASHWLWSGQRSSRLGDVTPEEGPSMDGDNYGGCKVSNTGSSVYQSLDVWLQRVARTQGAVAGRLHCQCDPHTTHVTAFQNKAARLKRAAMCTRENRDFRASAYPTKAANHGREAGAWAATGGSLAPPYQWPRCREGLRAS